MGGIYQFANPNITGEQISLDHVDKLSDTVHQQECLIMCGGNQWVIWIIDLTLAKKIWVLTALLTPDTIIFSQKIIMSRC